jgi:23S rRNA pseudouridine2605 synthase
VSFPIHSSSFLLLPSTLRLARYLARCGVASRRAAEEIISAGRVAVNGEVATDLGRQILPGRDIVTVEGRAIEWTPANLTLLHHKPRGVLVSRSDPHHNGQTVFDLLPAQYAPESDRLVYAGRLDRESEGLLLLSTDGELVNLLVHPRHHVEKEYLVTLDGPLTAAQVASLAGGLELDDGPTQPCTVERLRNNRVRMVLREGRNRQIRRMLAVVGRRVQRLVRTRLAGLQLGDLKPGEFRPVSEEELAALRQAAGQPSDSGMDPH